MDRIEYCLTPEQEEKVELYRTTPEGEIIWSFLDKIDRYCHWWMNPRLYIKMKKEIFIQWCESHPTIVEKSED